MKKVGMSLIEVLIAAAILIMAMVPLFVLLGSSHQQVKVSIDEISASHLALEILEQVENFRLPIIQKTLVENLEIKSNAVFKLPKLANREIYLSEIPDYMKMDGRLSLEPLHSEIPKYQGMGMMIKVELSFFPKEKTGTGKKKVFFSSIIGKE